MSRTSSEAAVEVYNIFISLVYSEKVLQSFQFFILKALSPFTRISQRKKKEKCQKRQILSRGLLSVCGNVGHTFLTHTNEFVKKSILLAEGEVYFL